MIYRVPVDSTRAQVLSLFPSNIFYNNFESSVAKQESKVAQKKKKESSAYVPAK